MEAVGLAPGTRYRCEACGNVTRFDVELVERVRRFWHADLAGAGQIEEEERLEVSGTRVTCRWCGSSDAIQVIPVPGGAGAERVSTGGTGAERVPTGGTGVERVPTGGTGAERVPTGGTGAERVPNGASRR